LVHSVLSCSVNVNSVQLKSTVIKIIESSAFISKNGKLGRYVPHFNSGMNISCKWAWLETKNSEKYQDTREMKVMWRNLYYTNMLYTSHITLPDSMQ